MPGDNSLSLSVNVAINPSTYVVPVVPNMPVIHPAPAAAKPTISISEIIEKLPDLPTSPQETQLDPIASGSRLPDANPSPSPSPTVPNIATYSEADSNTTTSSTVSSSAEEKGKEQEEKSKGKGKAKEQDEGEDKPKRKRITTK